MEEELPIPEWAIFPFTNQDRILFDDVEYVLNSPNVLSSQKAVIERYIEDLKRVDHSRRLILDRFAFSMKRLREEVQPFF